MAQQLATSTEYNEQFSRLLIKQIHPDLDIAWQERLSRIFSEMPEEWCVKINKEVLTKKKIHWDKKRNNFLYLSKYPKLEDFIKTSCHPKLRPVAAWCTESITSIKKTNSVIEIANIIENIMEKINGLDLDGDFDLLACRRALRENFIVAVAATIKEKKHLDVPESQRHFNTDVMKSFICEVFLKQQLLGYEFHIIRKRRLSQMSHPFLSVYLSKEQGIRKLEVIYTTQYLFAVTTSHESDVNLFSVRRFLTDERILNYTYINGVFIKLDQFDNPLAIKDFEKQVSSIVSIEGRVNIAIVEMFEDIEEHYHQNIRSKLFKALDSYNISLERAICRRLQEYEYNLESEILSQVKKGLLQLAKHNDDFNYLFVSLRQLIGEIIFDFKDFQSQPTILNDLAAEKTMMHLLAYLELISKRHDRIFNPSAISEWEENSKAAARPMESLGDIIKKSTKQYMLVKNKLLELEKLQEKKDSFFDKLLQRRKKREKNLAALRTSFKNVQRTGYVDMLNLFIKFKSEMLYLEQESILLMKRQRNYALSAGNNGVDMLPILISLPENYREFNPNQYLEPFVSKKKLPVEHEYLSHPVQS